MLDAIAEVVAEEGYRATTVQMILRRAGISRRTYYEIFKDKEDCFLVAYQEAVDHVLELTQSACRASKGNPEQRIESGLRAMLDFAGSEPKLARTCVVEVMAAGPAARERRQRTMERLTEMVAETLSERGDESRETLLRARVLTGGVHELVYDSLARGRIRNLPQLASEAVATHLSYHSNQP